MNALIQVICRSLAAFVTKSSIGQANSRSMKEIIQVKSITTWIMNELMLAVIVTKDSKSKVSAKDMREFIFSKWTFPFEIINCSKQTVTTLYFFEHPRNNILASVLVKESASVKYKRV